MTPSPISRRGMLKSTAVTGTGLALWPGLRNLMAAPAGPRGFRISACDWSIGRVLTPEALDLAQEIGLDGVEVSFDRPGNGTDLREAAARRAYQDAVDRTGVEVSSLAMGVLNSVPLAESDEAERYVEECITAMREMGQKTVLLAFFGGATLRGRPERFPMLIERLKRLAPRAEAAGVTLALETELDADDHMRIVDAVASPAVKVYYDVRNMTDLGFDIYSEIPYLARKGALAQIHMKENGALLGHGVVDFVRVRKAVDEAEYRGWIVIESAVPPGAQIAPAYAHNARYLRTLFPEGADAPRGRMATPEFTIGFSERSLLRSIAAGTMTQLEIPAFAARELGTPELEHVSEAFPGGPEDTDHLRKLRHACEQNGVSSRVLTCREDLQLGAPDPDLRERAAAAYARWVDAAAALACPAVAVALESQGDWDQQVERAADGLRRLCEYAEEKGVSVLVENADGQSCNHAWLSEVLERTGKTNCGVLLDYAAFDGYNGPRAAAALAPRVRAVSAQARSFDGAGHETNTDFFAMTRTVLQGGYNGMVAIEYVGSGDEIQGIHRTRRLLELARVNPEGGPGGQAGPPPVVRVDFGDRGKWKIQAVDSQETSGEDGKAANILDGHEESFWHTEWSQKTPPHPHHVVVDLGEETDLVGVRYLGRQGAMSNGRIRDYEIYVSNHPEEWGKPVCEGHFENSPAEQHAQFGKARGRYLVVKALSEVNGNNWTTIAELGILTP